MKIILYDGNWSKEEIETQKDTLFLYEDDEAKTTSISFRELKNVFPIYTRKNNKVSGKYKDKDFDEGIQQKIDDNFNMLDVFISKNNFKNLSLPFNGLDSKLGSSPYILKYLTNKINTLIERIKQEENNKREKDEIISWNIS